MPVLTLASGAAPRLILDLLVILAAAAVVAALFRRAKLQTITGFVVAGAIVGPNAWGLVRQPESVDQISALATMLLMFGIGLQLDMQHMRRGMVSITTIGVVSTLAVALVLWGGAVVLGLPAPAGLAVALAFSISSTAVLIRALLERREFNQQHGRITLGVSLVQDLASVAILSLMPALAHWAGARAHAAGPAPAPHGMDGVADAFIGLGAVALFIVAGRLALPRLVHAVARLGGDSGSRGGGSGSGAASELVLVLSAAIAVGAAIASGALGLSPELGAFVAGFLLGSTPYRHQLVGQFAPLRDLLMAVFFTAVGLKVNPAGILDHWPVLAAAMVGVIAVKAAIIGATAWSLGASPRVAAVSGVYLANAGEFSFVVLAAAVAQGVLGPQGEGNAIAVVILTLIINPAMLGPSHRWADRLLGARAAPWIKGRGLARHADPEPAEHRVEGKRVIIAGFGPVGRHMADRFKRMGTLVTIIDLNPRTVNRQNTLGRDVIFGDVTSREVLESAGLTAADALILTIPDEDATIRACATARSMNPRLFIAARASYLSRGLAARQAGADHVTVEELATAEVMERQVVEALALHDEARPPAAAGA